MRRSLVPILLTCTLALAACGDDEESTGSSAGGETTAAESTPAETAATSPTGCKTVDQPKPKTDAERKKPSLKIDRSKKYTAVMTTNCGTIEIALDAKRAPKTVASFVALARDGFFDDLTFHRIAGGFVIQGGDPADQRPTETVLIDSVEIKTG